MAKYRNPHLFRRGALRRRRQSSKPKRVVPSLHPSPTPQDPMFHTNDRLVIRERLSRPGPATLQVNNLPAVNLGRRGLLLLKILVFHSYTQAGLSTPRKVGDALYLPVAEIIATIETILAEEGVTDLYRNAVDKDILGVIYQLREGITQMGGNRNLIQHGPRGTGYRLSTPASNILLLP